MTAPAPISALSLAVAVWLNRLFPLVPGHNFSNRLLASSSLEPPLLWGASSGVVEENRKYEW